LRGTGGQILDRPGGPPTLLDRWQFKTFQEVVEHGGGDGVEGVGDEVLDGEDRLAGDVDGLGDGGAAVEEYTGERIAGVAAVDGVAGLVCERFGVDDVGARDQDVDVGAGVEVEGDTVEPDGGEKFAGVVAVSGMVGG
jgi:hypothetical protein